MSIKGQDTTAFSYDDKLKANARITHTQVGLAQLNPDVKQ